MTFWRCFYHIVWSVKSREKRITPQAEPIIFESIQEKSHELGCDVLAINGTEDHIHIAVNIPPKLAVAEWVRHAKGVSSHQVNTLIFPDAPARFRWQAGYGVLTFGKTNLKFVKGYIENQKQHPASSNVEHYLEYSGDPD